MNPFKIMRRGGNGVIDQRLAAGERADGDGRLARRAKALVSADSRDTVARGLLEIVGAAERRPAPTNRAPIARQEVAGAADELRSLATGLRSDGPIDARGVAGALLLLTDGSGPLYNRRSSERLDATARAARLALTPAVA
jgi:hypothetical protein